jgi:hypothetical protein
MSDISLKSSFSSGFRDSNSWKRVFAEWAVGMKSNMKIPAVNSLYWSFRERAESAKLSVPFENFHQHFM